MTANLPVYEFRAMLRDVDGVGERFTARLDTEWNICIANREPLAINSTYRYSLQYVHLVNPQTSAVGNA